MLKQFTLLAAMLAASACASNSAYVAADDANSYGYYSTPLGENRYRITFNGNSSTGRNTVTDYALLRASELTLDQHMDWFQVVERTTNTVEKSSAGAGITHRTEPTVQRDCGLLGCTTTMRPETGTTFGADTVTSRTTYSVSLEIVMGNDPVPENDGRYYDAESLMKSLWEAM